MSLMSACVQSSYRFVLVRMRFVHQKESCDGPKGVEFGFAIDEMLKISGNLHVRNDAPQGFRRKVCHRHNVRWIYITWRHSTLPVQFLAKTVT